MRGARLSERLGPLKRWLTGHWPGRIALGSLAEFGRMDLFDRAMAIAAQPSRPSSRF